MSRSRTEQKFKSAQNKYRLGKYEQASELFRAIFEQCKAIDLEAAQAALLNLGASLRAVKKFQDAIEIYNTFVNLYGATFESLYNRANALNAVGDFQKAIDDYHNALTYDNQNQNALQNLAECYINSGRIDEADLIYQKLKTYRPFDPAINYGLALNKLRQRSFSAGWDLYAWRHFDTTQCNPIIYNQYVNIERFNAAFDHFKRDPKAFSLIAEQGVGDTIMFMSRLKSLIDANAKVEFFIDDRFLNLTKNSFPDILWKSTNDLNGNIKGKMYMPVGELMRFPSAAVDSNNPTPYLNPTSHSKKHFHELLHSKKRQFTIGISWLGGTSKTRTSHRSINLELLLHQTVGDMDVQLVDIQHNSNLHEYALNKPVTQFDQKSLNDLDKLAGLISNLDLVLTVQNTNVHLAGAIGTKCFALLPKSPEWRYGLVGDNLPWYDSVRLFRQEELGEWGQVCEKVKSEISKQYEVWKNVK